MWDSLFSFLTYAYLTYILNGPILSAPLHFTSLHYMNNEDNVDRGFDYLILNFNILLYLL